MANISQIELENLKHFIISSDTLNSKLTFYSSSVIDSQLKQLFTKGAQDSLNEKETLMTFFNN